MKRFKIRLFAHLISFFPSHRGMMNAAGSSFVSIKDHLVQLDDSRPAPYALYLNALCQAENQYWVSLHHSVWPKSHYVDCAGLELTVILLSQSFPTPGAQVCTIMLIWHGKIKEGEMWVSSQTSLPEVQEWWFFYTVKGAAWLYLLCHLCVVRVYRAK